MRWGPSRDPCPRRWRHWRPHRQPLPRSAWSSRRSHSRPGIGWSNRGHGWGFDTIPQISASMNQPVAVFDSGVGGLTVLHELLVSLPGEDYLYLGDTARFPYGERTQRELQAFAIEVADHLLSEGTKLIVVACNAASSAALDVLEDHVRREGLEIDVIGVVAPATQLAV